VCQCAQSKGSGGFGFRSLAGGGESCTLTIIEGAVLLGIRSALGVFLLSMCR
jgi:hypothetical protein